VIEKYDGRLVSAITLFEIYKICLEKEGKETAETRILRYLFPARARTHR